MPASVEMLAVPGDPAWVELPGVPMWVDVSGAEFKCAPSCMHSYVKATMILSDLTSCCV